MEYQHRIVRKRKYISIRNLMQFPHISSCLCSCLLAYRSNPSKFFMKKVKIVINVAKCQTTQLQNPNQ